MINLIQFYNKGGERFVMNGSSIPASVADYADQRVRDFLTQFCIEAHLVERVMEHHGGSDYGYANKVLDEAKIVSEAKSRGIGIAFDEADMRRRCAPTIVTLDDIRRQLSGAIRKGVWDHALAVVDIIEEKAAGDLYYADLVDQWLCYPECSTIWLRDEVMEPLRYTPQIVEIGKQFNPTTEWHNTWMPLDAAIHRVRNGIDPEEW